MHIAITGGSGFLGQKLAKALLERGYLVDPEGSDAMLEQLTLIDAVKFPRRTDRRVRTITGDICDPLIARTFASERADVIFHLAAVVSGEAEQNFELGMRVNLGGIQNLLEACRQAGYVPRFVFASSVAVFGGELPAVVQDNTATIPQSSYGVQKALGELLVNDYSRRGFVNGRVVRLPTIVVRPGQPNRATSTFASSIIREPLQGQTALCPVSPELRLWVMSPRRAVQNLIHAAELPADAWGDNRIVSLPGLTVSVQQMIESLARVAGAEAVSLIKRQPDPSIENIVGSWPARFNPERAVTLGFEADTSFDEIVRAFMEDELQKQ